MRAEVKADKAIHKVNISTDTKRRITRYILSHEIETGAKLTCNDVLKMALDKLFAADETGSKEKLA